MATALLVSSYVIINVLVTVFAMGRDPYFVMGNGGPQTYRFGYDTRPRPQQEVATPKGVARLMREESRLEDGTVVGRYGYTDPFGVFRVVKYVAGPNGYYAFEDIGGASNSNIPLFRATARQKEDPEKAKAPASSVVNFNPPLYHPEAHLADPSAKNDLKTNELSGRQAAASNEHHVSAEAEEELLEEEPEVGTEEDLLEETTTTTTPAPTTQAASSSRSKKSTLVPTGRKVTFDEDPEAEVVSKSPFEEEEDIIKLLESVRVPDDNATLINSTVSLENSSSTVTAKATSPSPSGSQASLEDVLKVLPWLSRRKIHQPLDLHQDINIKERPSRPPTTASILANLAKELASTTATMSNETSETSTPMSVTTTVRSSEPISAFGRASKQLKFIPPLEEPESPSVNQSIARSANLQSLELTTQHVAASDGHSISTEPSVALPSTEAQQPTTTTTPSSLTTTTTPAATTSPQPVYREVTFDDEPDAGLIYSPAMPLPTVETEPIEVALTSTTVPSVAVTDLDTEPLSEADVSTSTPPSLDIRMDLNETEIEVETGSPSLANNSSIEELTTETINATTASATTEPVAMLDQTTTSPSTTPSVTEALPYATRITTTQPPSTSTVSITTSTEAPTTTTKPIETTDPVPSSTLPPSTTTTLPSTTSTTERPSTTTTTIASTSTTTTTEKVEVSNDEASRRPRITSIPWTSRKLPFRGKKFGRFRSGVTESLPFTRISTTSTTVPTTAKLSTIDGQSSKTDATTTTPVPQVTTKLTTTTSTTTTTTTQPTTTISSTTSSTEAPLPERKLPLRSKKLKVRKWPSQEQPSSGGNDIPGGYVPPLIGAPRGLTPAPVRDMSGSKPIKLEAVESRLSGDKHELIRSVYIPRYVPPIALQGGAIQGDLELAAANDNHAYTKLADQITMLTAMSFQAPDASPMNINLRQHEVAMMPLPPPHESRRAK